MFYTKEEKDLLEGFVSVLTGDAWSATTTCRGRASKGAEGDALWVPLPESNSGLVLTAAVSYLNAKYTDYPNGRGFDDATGLAFGNGFPLPLLPARNLSGNWVTRTPNLTYNATVTQTVPLGDGSVEMALDGNYNSGYYFLPQDSPLYRCNAYYLLNAHVTYTYDRWHTQMHRLGQEHHQPDLQRERTHGRLRHHGGGQRPAHLRRAGEMELLSASGRCQRRTGNRAFFIFPFFYFLLHSSGEPDIELSCPCTPAASPPPPP